MLAWKVRFHSLDPFLSTAGETVLSCKNGLSSDFQAEWETPETPSLFAAYRQDLSTPEHDALSDSVRL